MYIHSQFVLAQKEHYLLFLQSSLIPWQEACLSSPLIVAFQYWEFLSEGGEKKCKQINMTVSTIELIKSLSAKNKANPILGPSRNDFINKLIRGEEKKMCFVTCCFKTISFFLSWNKAIVISYDNGHI